MRNTGEEEWVYNKDFESTSKKSAVDDLLTYLDIQDELEYINGE
jgi:hypothetical protein